MTDEVTDQLKHLIEMEKEGLEPEKLEQKAEKESLSSSEKERFEVSQETLFRIHQLITLVEGGELRSVQEMLNDQTIGVNVQNERGISPLMAAAMNGRVRLTEYLIEKQADLDLRDEKGKTALVMAISNGYNRTAQVLMESGAGLNIQTQKGLTALMKAVQKGDIDMVEGLLKRGADLNQQDCYGLTALMHAVQAGYSDLALLLLVSGADIEKKDVTGKTARDWANVYSQVECMHLFEKMAQNKEEDAKEAMILGFAQVKGAEEKEDLGASREPQKIAFSKIRVTDLKVNTKED